jgi:hypothetical protein
MLPTNYKFQNTCAEMYLYIPKGEYTVLKGSQDH